MIRIVENYDFDNNKNDNVVVVVVVVVVMMMIMMMMMVMMMRMMMMIDINGIYVDDWNVNVVNTISRTTNTTKQNQLLVMVSYEDKPVLGKNIIAAGMIPRNTRDAGIIPTKFSIILILLYVYMFRN